MSHDPNAFTVLRRRIRQAGTQFRKNNDNSDSIFHPVYGFCYAYDISQVEEALDNYESDIPSEYREEKAPIPMKEQIIEMGNYMCKHHDSMEARDFARNVLAWFAIHDKSDQIKPTASLKSVPGVQGEQDTLT